MSRCEVTRLSDTLALDPTCSDYDLWRAIKTLDDQLYKIQRESRPVPIRILYARRIFESARAKRSGRHG